ncbi:MAG: NADP-dependent oxidoreductase [Actinocatenispora sp.]
MKALLIRRYGGTDVLEFAEVERPRPGPGELGVVVHAAGINPLDHKIRAGKLRLLRGQTLPLILGNEVSGVVAEVGPAVTGFAPGDEVYARLAKDTAGGFAEQVTVPARYAAVKPKTLGHEQAAAIPLAALTGWQALTGFGTVGAGSTVLVHGGAGGVGSFAVQLARHLGATVVATASARNAELVGELGAEQVVDYRTEAFERRMRADGLAADLVLDTQGGAVLRRSFSVVRRGGSVVSVGAAVPTPASVRDERAVAPVRGVMAVANLPYRYLARRAGCGYAYLFMRPDGGQLAELATLVDGGQLRPVLDRVFPFEEAMAALAHVERGGGPGKTVLTMPAGATG